MPSIATTKAYEAVYIVDPDLGEDQVQAIINRYRQVVETAGGTVASAQVWERRKLAYQIKGRTEGIYIVMQFSGVPKVEAELRRIFQISEDQLRSMIIVAEPSAIPLPPAAPDAQPEAAPAAVAADVPEPAPVQAEAPQPEPEAAQPAPEAAADAETAEPAAV